MIVGEFRIWLTSEEFNWLQLAMQMLGENVYRGDSVTTWRFDTSLNWGKRMCMNSYDRRDPHWQRIREVALKMGGTPYDKFAIYGEECDA